MRQRGTNWGGILLCLLVVLLLGGISTIAVFEFFQIKELRGQVDAGQAATGDAKTSVFELNKEVDSLRAQLSIAQQETPQQTQARLLTEVAKQYELPKGEQPTVSQVIDKTKLNNQPFLKDVENGDYILIYNKAKLSIVYRLSEQKIINSGPVETSEKSGS